MRTKASRNIIASSANAVTEQLSLILANLRLRETLRNQSIRDPQTGLFNRRYMEDSLDRELNRAERSGKPLVVAMLDLDHFRISTTVLVIPPAMRCCENGAIF